MELFKDLLLRVVAHAYKPSNQGIEASGLLQVWNNPGLIITIEPYIQLYTICTFIWQLELHLPLDC